MSVVGNNGDVCLTGDGAADYRRRVFGWKEGVVVAPTAELHFGRRASS
jgi:hypothetical protein